MADRVQVVCGIMACFAEWKIGRRGSRGAKPCFLLEVGYSSGLQADLPGFVKGRCHMGRIRLAAVGGLFSFCFLSILSGCGGSSGTTTITSTPSYTLSASALTPATVTVGGTATSTITVAPANGYTGTVTVSCAPVPGGPACSFLPTLITISGTAAATSVLTVSTTGVGAGSFSITVNATDANSKVPSNGSQTLTLTTVVPGYTLSASALNPATVTAGNSATSTVTITPAHGYTGSVNLSCSVIATSAPTCSFNPATVTISGTAAGASTLTVSTATSLAGGPYNVTVQASGANNLGPSNGSQTLPLVMTAVIQHVVIIFQENRTPDNLFYGLCVTPYGSTAACSTTPSSTQYNIQTANWLDAGVTGGTVNPAPITLANNYDLSHAHSAFVDMCDLNTTTNVCAMDGAYLIPTPDCNISGTDCPPNQQYQYVNPSEVAPYLQMAQTYTFGDQMFQTNEGPSYPAHQFILGGTSEPWVGSGLFVSENPAYVTGTTAGCIAQSTTTVKAIDANGVETAAGSNVYLCAEHETLTDEMDAANPPVSWRYYAPSEGSIWTAPTAIEHMCGVGTAGSGGGTNGGNCTGPDYMPGAGQPIKVVTNEGTQTGAQILSDISGGNLQQVSWVIPAGQFSDHAFSNTGCGPSWVTSIVNAIGTSPYWANTVIIVTWDDWGGWYDHVPPPKVIDDGTSWGSGYVYGFRVPIMVISPYIAKSGYISHNTHDFGSILNYMENTFGLGQLGFADSNTTDDLSDFLNLSQSPIGFTTITPPSDDSTCKGDASPPTDPDDD